MVECEIIGLDKYRRLLGTCSIPDETSSKPDGPSPNERMVAATVGAQTKLIVHNYGHGGAGITLSWGCASKVRDFVQAQRPAAGAAIAVLGSGVMGLTAATLLLELGFPLTIYIKEAWNATTASVAGGQWAPSIVKYADEVQFKDVLEVSYRTFKASIGNGFGVSERPNYCPKPDDALDKVLQLLPGLLPARQTLAGCLSSITPKADTSTRRCWSNRRSSSSGWRPICAPRASPL